MLFFFPDDGLRKYDMEFLKPSLVSWRRGSPTVTRVTSYEFRTKMDFWKAKDRKKSMGNIEFESKRTM